MTSIFHVRGNVLYDFDSNEDVDDFYPYFYVIGNEPPKFFENYERVDLNPLVFDGFKYVEVDKRVWRVYAREPGEVPAMRNEAIKHGFATSQSYIKYAYRAGLDFGKLNLGRDIKDLIERGLKSEVSFASVDIEVVGDNVVVGYSLDGDDVDFIVSDVRRVQKDVFEGFPIDFTYLVTYNGWGFDVQYLPSMGKYALKTPDGLRPIMDLFAFFAGGFKASLGLTKEALGLYDVASEFNVHEKLGLDKREFMRLKLKRSRISELSMREIKDYLRIDVLTTHYLAKKIMPILSALSSVLDVNPMIINQIAETASPGHLAEGVIHKYGVEKEGIVLQDVRRDFNYEAGEKARARSSGVFHNVVELDFSALYPSLMIQDHVGPIGIKECQNGFPVRILHREIKKYEERRVCFDGDWINSIIKYFYNARLSTKELKKKYGEAPDQAVKILVNSAYGIFGKEGFGIINPWVAGYIAQKTTSIQDYLWSVFDGVYYKHLNSVYSDTDSLYVVLDGTKPEDVLNDVNSEVGKRWGELLKMKIEGVWDWVFIPSGEDRNPLRKAYVKYGGEGIKIKGAKFSPRWLPRGLRYGEYEDFIASLILNPRKYADLINDFVKSAPLDELFIEDSMRWFDLVFTREGGVTKHIDRKRINALASIAGMCRSARILILENKIAFTCNNESGGEKHYVNPNEFLNVLVIPIEMRGEVKKYVVLLGDKPYYIEFKYKWSGAREVLTSEGEDEEEEEEEEDSEENRLVIEVRSDARKEVTPEEVRKVARRYLMEHDIVTTIIRTLRSQSSILQFT